MTIAALAGAGLLLVLLLVFGLGARRRGKRLRRALDSSRAEATEHAAAAEGVRRQLTVATAGEREAVWAAQATGSRAATLADQVSGLEDRLAAAGARAATVERDLSEVRLELDRVREGSALQLRDADARAAALAADLAEAHRDIARVTAELVAAQHELDRLRALTEGANARAAALEADLAREREEVSRLRSLPVAPAAPPVVVRQEDDELRHRLHGALAEADRLRDRIGALETTLALSRLPDPADPAPPMLAADPWDTRQQIETRDALIARLTSELDEAHRAGAGSREEIARLADEIARVREEADLRVSAATSGLISPKSVAPLGEQSPRLAAREAEVRDLEQRLAALTATRNSELKRLNERIASLERLYLDLDVRDSRIAELEAELKQAVEMLEAIRGDATDMERRLADAQREVGEARRAEADSSALAAQLDAARRRVVELETAALRAGATNDEVKQLRSLLAAERDRTERMERRATEGRSEELARAVAAATQPLQERIAWLEAELAARSAPPPAPPVRDDVLLIRGIGPKIAAILATHGVTSLRQIATFTEADIARIGPLLPVYPNRIADDNWVDQARDLISGIA